MNKCPRCENENLKEDYNFCPICGLNLKEEERRIVIRNLKFMKSNYENAKANDSDAEEFREICIKTLEYAINELERTAQEVPVQEQLVTLEVLNNELNINLSQKQYEEIAILDFCTPKYTTYEILKLLKTLSVI